MISCGQKKDCGYSEWCGITDAESHDIPGNLNLPISIKKFNYFLAHWFFQKSFLLSLVIVLKSFETLLKRENTAYPILIVRIFRSLNLNTVHF